MTDSRGEVVVSALSKQFGPVRAVDNVSFTAGPGTVTGFLLLGWGVLFATAGWLLTVRRDIP